MFHVFSPDQLNGSVTQVNRKTLRPLFEVTVYSRSWVRESVNIWTAKSVHFDFAVDRLQ